MIKLTNVTKVYKTGVRALNNMNLTIEPGEFVYVIGTTGAGKSTFIKLLRKKDFQEPACGDHWPAACRDPGYYPADNADYRISGGNQGAA